VVRQRRSHHASQLRRQWDIEGAVVAEKVPLRPLLKQQRARAPEVVGVRVTFEANPIVEVATTIRPFATPPSMCNHSINLIPQRTILEEYWWRRHSGRSNLRGPHAIRAKFVEMESVGEEAPVLRQVQSGG